MQIRFGNKSVRLLFWIIHLLHWTTQGKLFTMPYVITQANIFLLNALFDVLILIYILDY